MIVGRQQECGRIDAVLGAARAGRPTVLVLRGEPGIGKTMLLEWAARQASDMVIGRAVGLESEAGLEFSDLYDVLRPMTNHLQDLPERQQEALSVALGLAPGTSVDRFAIGAGVLSLVSAAAETSPVLIMIDDDQWVDAASGDALRFALRRLTVERVAVLVGTRPGRSMFADERRFPALEVSGVDAEACRALLAEHSGTEVAPEVADRIRVATGGNPLALVEVAGLLGPRQLGGLEPIEDPLPVGRRVERLFTERVRRLPATSRQALLVAAVSASPRLAPVLAALGQIGLDLAALECAEDAGLVGLSADLVIFRHPLVRSAVVHGAPASERRQAHAALAAVLDSWAEDQRAHHLAAAAVGPDDDIAAAVAAAAERTRVRGGWAAAAAAFERSARLSTSVALRHDRLLEAAESGWVAGQIELTTALVGEVVGEASGLDAGPVRDRAQHLRSRIGLHCGHVGQALTDLEAVAGRARQADPEASESVWADAVEAALLVGDLDRAVEAGRRAHAAAGEDVRTRFVGAFALGQALDAAGQPEQAREHLGAALDLLAGSELLRAETRACTRGAEAADRLGRTEVGLLDVGLAWAGRACELARDQGAFGPLAHALAAQASLDLAAGRWPQACAHATEGLDRADDSRCAWTAVRCLEHLAWLRAAQGRTAECRREAKRAATAAGKAGFTSRRSTAALGLLELGLGRPDEAAHLLGALDGPPEPDLVEALVRCGRRSDAAALALPPGAPGLRCRALLVTDEGFAEQFEAALRSAASERPFDEARLRLCFGERLRRMGLRIEARTQLRAARETFDRLGARPWVDRAGTELRATGERLGRREPRHGDELTPQELQVALLAADGATNKVIGAALFLSPKTVDFHLRRALRKLDLTSRAGLIKHFATTLPTTGR